VLFGLQRPKTATFQGWTDFACGRLFRTAVATTGMAALKTNFEPGIGTDTAKAVADCIHSSHVEDIGLALLKKESDLMEGDDSADFTLDYDRLSEYQATKFQLQLARLILTFVELLHLLIARNRNMLLNVFQERKKGIDLVGNGILHSEMPGWLKKCTLDNYFSLGTYRRTKISNAEELCSTASETAHSRSDTKHRSYCHFSHSEHGGYDSPRGSIGGASQNSTNAAELKVLFKRVSLLHD
jgi:hypothetical protein